MSRGETLFIKTAAIYRLPLFLPFNHLQKEPIFAKETICISSIFLLVVGVEKDIIKAKPTEKFISMNLFKIICVVTQA